MALEEMAPPAPARSPMMSELQPQPDAIDPNDLMTDEERASLGLTDEAPNPVATAPFDANLAEYLDENDLKKLGQSLIEIIDADTESQGDWSERISRGLEVIGLKDYKWADSTGGANPMAPFPGASTVVYPVLAEAGVQSMSRAVEELNPATGPCKTQVMGEETPDKRDSADRVADHMNYQLTIEDKVYPIETNQLHLYNTWFGTSYRKCQFDPKTGRNVLRWVRGEDLIMPYDATCYESSPRATHRFRLTENDLKTYQRRKFYRDVDLGEPPAPDTSRAEEAIAKVDGKTESRADDDVIFDMYEIDIELCLEDVDAEDETSPYTITVEKNSETILSIRRNYKQTDPLKARRTRYAEYWYLPGLGSKGYGLLHVLGTLAATCTDALRALFDSATWSNMQGGFKAKDAAVKAGTLTRIPNAWLDVDMTAEELKSGFYTPPTHEPSSVLFELLGHMVEICRRFTATTDLMVGDGKNTGPVGTTIAMIEQGQKVYSGVHKRGHVAVGVELRMLFEANGETVPAEGYPYKVPGDSLVVYRQDYNSDLVAVVPVSDPNIFSQTQRIAQAQAEYQLAKENPTLFRMRRVIERVMKAMKIPDIDDVLIDPDNMPMLDPVTENVSMLTGRPVRAKEGENHLAHMAVHMAFAQHPQFGGIPQAQDLMGPAMIAHVAEHLGLYYAETMRKMGVPIPPINLAGGQLEPISEGTQNGGQIAQMAAAMIGQFMQTSGITVPVGGGAADDAAKATTRKTNADAFMSLSTAILNLVKASQTVQQGEAELAGLGGALDGGTPPAPGASGPAPAPQPAAAPPAQPQPQQPEPAPAASQPAPGGGALPQ